MVLADLDRTECAPRLIRDGLPIEKHPNLVFRAAVREVGSWVLAHRKAFASYLGTSQKRIPLNVDKIIEPKHFIN